MERKNLSSEAFLLKELEPLRNVKSVATVTLMTYDVPIPVTEKQLAIMDLGKDSWHTFTSSSSDAAVFLERFEHAYGEKLITRMKRTRPIHRRGGAALVTGVTTVEKKSDLTGVAIVPVGSGGQSGPMAEIVDYVAVEAGKMVSESNKLLSGKFWIEAVPSPGTTPIILSFYHPDGRSMVLIKDESVVAVPESLIDSLPKPTLLLMDARDLRGESFKNGAIEILQRPDTYLVLGLGAEKVIPSIMGEIKELMQATTGPIAFAGNRGEVKTLLEYWNRAKTLPEFMLETRLNWLLETNSKNSASSYTRVENEIIPATAVIPPDKQSNNDGTNAGDYFGGDYMAGLMMGLTPLAALNFAIDDTYVFLEERAASERARSTFPPLK